MSDPLTPAQRHKCMASIHGSSTKPEVKVRRWLWRAGYRYRLEKIDNTMRQVTIWLSKWLLELWK